MAVCLGLGHLSVSLSTATAGRGNVTSAWLVRNTSTEYPTLELSEVTCCPLAPAPARSGRLVEQVSWSSEAVELDPRRWKGWGYVPGTGMAGDTRLGDVLTRAEQAH